MEQIFKAYGTTECRKSWCYFLYCILWNLRLVKIINKWTKKIIMKQTLNIFGLKKKFKTIYVLKINLIIVVVKYYNLNIVVVKYYHLNILIILNWAFYGRKVFQSIHASVHSIMGDLASLILSAGATTGRNCSLCKAGTYQTGSGQGITCYEPLHAYIAWIFFGVTYSFSSHTF